MRMLIIPSDLEALGKVVEWLNDEYNSVLWISAYIKVNHEQHVYDPLGWIEVDEHGLSVNFDLDTFLIKDINEITLDFKTCDEAFDIDYMGN